MVALSLSRALVLSLPFWAPVAATYRTITQTTTTTTTTTVVSTSCYTKTIAGEKTTITEYFTHTKEVEVPCPTTIILTETDYKTDYETLTDYETDYETKTDYEKIYKTETKTEHETDYETKTDYEKIYKTIVSTVTDVDYKTKTDVEKHYYTVTETDKEYVHKTATEKEVATVTCTETETETKKYPVPTTLYQKATVTKTEKYPVTVYETDIEKYTVTKSCSGLVTAYTTTLVTVPIFYTIGTTHIYEKVSKSYYVSGTSTLNTYITTTTSTTYIPGTRPPQTTEYYHGITTAPHPPNPCGTITITKTVTYEPEVVTAVQYRETVATTFSTAAEGVTATVPVEVATTEYTSYTSTYLVAVPTTLTTSSTYTPPPPPPPTTTVAAPPVATGAAGKVERAMGALMGVAFAAAILA